MNVKTNSNQEYISKVIEGCINADRASQKVLYRMFYSKMLGVCMRYSHNTDEAKDLLQEGFIKVFSSISTFQRSGSFEGWVRRIIVNTSIDFYRKNKKHLFKIDSEYIETHIESIEDESEENKYDGIQPNDVMEAVQQLSPVYRTIFNMYAVDGYTHKQIADQLGIREGTSKSNYSKAKANLRKLLVEKIKKTHE
jgi:RNA polymerase sigma-70 factor, ECF subfamily